MIDDKKQWCDFCGNSGYADIAEIAAQDREGKEWVLRKDNKTEWREHYRKAEIDVLIKDQVKINKF